MSRLLFLLLLCGCAGSLVDNASLGGGGTPHCIQTCTTTPVPSALPFCVGDTCTYQCQDGKLKCSNGCCDVTSLSAGASHTCAVVAGEARCWGANDLGQLGRSGADSFVPVQPAGLAATVTAIAAGSDHTCAIAAGEVWCWGDNPSGQLGNGSSAKGTRDSTPQKVSGSAGALLVAAGGSHSCFVTASEIFCWGSNAKGQVGDPTIDSIPRLAPALVSGVSGPSAISAGDSHTCAVTTAGTVCWGANGAGQLGNGTAGLPVSTPAMTSPAVKGGAFIGLGANHSCSGDASGTLYCWGANALSQVNGSGQDLRSPKDVLSSAVSVAGGIGHTCAVTSNGDVKCWGLNDKGQLGANGHEEVEVALQGGVQQVAAGYKHTCAVQNGAAQCWGSNSRGQLGADPAVKGSNSTPLPVSGR
jgi:alpha-tubulin suppressor-like RCC1 family protein